MIKILKKTSTKVLMTKSKIKKNNDVHYLSRKRKEEEKKSNDH
jgi:hypothetical protein